MATAKSAPTPTPDEATPPDQSTGAPADLDAALARIAELEAANAELATRVVSGAAEGETRVLRYVVVYPRIGVFPKDAEGNVIGDEVVLEQGDVLPDACLWNAGFLQKVGHVTPLAVNA